MTASIPSPVDMDGFNLGELLKSLSIESDDEAGT